MFCRFGGKVAAQFCALYTLYNQYKFDSVIDIYTLAYLYHQKRPGVWETQVSDAVTTVETVHQPKKCSTIPDVLAVIYLSGFLPISSRSTERERERGRERGRERD